MNDMIRAGITMADNLVILSPSNLISTDIHESLVDAENIAAVHKIARSEIVFIYSVSIHLSIHQHIPLSINRSMHFLSTHLSIHPYSSIDLSINISIYLHPSIYSYYIYFPSVYPLLQSISSCKNYNGYHVQI